MRDDKKLQEISDVVLKTLRTDFDNIEILEVNVQSDMDYEGEDILRIEIIFKGSPKSIDTSIFAGAVRHLRPKLSEIGEIAFPLMSFISDREIKGNGLAFS